MVVTKRRRRSVHSTQVLLYGAVRLSLQVRHLPFGHMEDVERCGEGGLFRDQTFLRCRSFHGPCMLSHDPHACLNHPMRSVGRLLVRSCPSWLGQDWDACLGRSWYRSTVMVSIHDRWQIVLSSDCLPIHFPVLSSNRMLDSSVPPPAIKNC